MTPLINTSQHNGNWLSLLSATFACFIIVTGEFLAIAVLNNIAADFHISTGTAGLTVTVTSIAGMMSALLIPIYAKTLDRRYVMLSLIVLMMIANLITAFSYNFNLVLLGRFALGIALGGFWGVAAGLVTRLAPAHLSTATALTIFFAAVTLVTVLGVPLGSWLADHYGWRTPYIALVVLGGVTLIIQYFSLPSLKPTSTLQWHELLLMPKHPIARKGLILFALVFLAHFSVYNYFTAFFKQSVDFSDNQISSLLLVFGVASVIGNILAGYLGRYNVRYGFALIALLLTITFLAFATGTIVLMSATLFVSLWGIAAGMVPTSINIWMHIHVPQLTEKGSALITFMFLILITIGSLVGGFIMDYFNGTILMASMLTISTLALFLVFTMTRGLSNVSP
ncbi:MAG: MFS transporter [Neisseriaceae bacterium]|nr:MFS transporter [Neisseriaceae bacterium]